MASRIYPLLLRLFLLVSLVGALLLQALALPALATSVAQQFPEVADLKYPTLAFAIFVLTCFEVALGCVWMLAGATRKGEVFSPSSLRWVNLICACLALTAVAFAGMFAFDVSRNIGPITVPMFFLALLFVNVGGLIAMLVLRQLLIQATRFRTELDEVI